MWNIASVNGTVYRLHGATMTIKCSHCTKNEVANQGNISSLQEANGRFKRKGWQINSRATKATCPECLVKFKSISKAKVNDMANQDAKLLPLLNPIQVRRIYAELEAYFDGLKGVYAQNHSDDTIAKELDIPRAHIVRIREEAFGKLKNQTEIAQLRADFDAAKALLDEALTGYRNQVNSFYDEFHNRIRKLGA